MRFRIPSLFLALLTMAACSPATKSLTFYDGHLSMRVPVDWNLGVEGQAKQVSTPSGDIVMTFTLFIKAGGEHSDFSRARFEAVDATTWAETADTRLTVRSPYRLDYRVYVDKANERRYTVFALSRDQYFLSLSFVSNQDSYRKDNGSIERVIADLRLQ